MYILLVHFQIELVGIYAYCALSICILVIPLSHERRNYSPALMMMIAFITFKSSLEPLFEGL